MRERGVSLRMSLRVSGWLRIFVEDRLEDNLSLRSRKDSLVENIYKNFGKKNLRGPGPCLGGPLI